MCVIAILSQCDCKTGKGAIAKNTPCRIKKEDAQNTLPEFQFTNSNKKMDVKVATSQDRVFSDCHA
jgi:hypothetical protein